MSLANDKSVYLSLGAPRKEGQFISFTKPAAFAQLAGEPLVVSGFQASLFQELDVFIYRLDWVCTKKIMPDLGQLD